jgi:hypothetical protein
MREADVPATSAEEADWKARLRDEGSLDRAAASENEEAASNVSCVDLHIKTQDTRDEAAAKSSPATSTRATVTRIRALFATETRESMRPRTSTRVMSEKENARGLNSRYTASMHGMSERCLQLLRRKSARAYMV